MNNNMKKIYNWGLLQLHHVNSLIKSSKSKAAASSCLSVSSTAMKLHREHMINKTDPSVITGRARSFCCVNSRAWRAPPEPERNNKVLFMKSNRSYERGKKKVNTR